MKFADLHDVSTWASGLGIDPSPIDFLNAKVSVSALASCAELFWPSFIIHRGCTLIEWSFDSASFDAWHDRLDGDTEAIEKTLNHMHIWDVFDPRDTIEEAVLLQLLPRLKITWKESATKQFPTSVFETSTSADKLEYGPTITIWSVGSATARMSQSIADS